jgi:glycosyltransferase involved in cell wall biosynthesis
MHVIATVTLNRNQLRAHLEPIADLPDVESIILVADHAVEPLPKVVTVVPPRWLVRVVGRATAKLLCLIVLAARLRPDWVIGYGLVPHGMNAVIAARVCGARSLVHLIGGPAEWQGGGWQGDNARLKRLRRPVGFVERVLLWSLSRADVVAVMGSGSRERLLERGFPPARVPVLPASVDPSRFNAPRTGRPRYQLVTAAALIELKRIGDFLAAIAALRPGHPQLRAAVAGRGPLEEELRARAEALGIADAVDFLGFVADMPALYADSELFALTSRTEGLSIAMTEAMIAGVPPIVTAVGEASDLVRPSETGFLFATGDVDALVRHADRLLRDHALRQRIAASAYAAAVAAAARRRVAQLSADILLTPRPASPRATSRSGPARSSRTALRA